jgi:hypothetical protein
MRLSLLSDDNEVAELLINKAIELMSQAETAAASEGTGAIDEAGGPGAEMTGAGDDPGRG